MTNPIWPAPPRLRGAGSEATRASKLLTAAVGQPVTVRPGLVFVATSRVTIKEPSDVPVLERRSVTRAIRRLPRQLSDDQVAVLYERARRPSTWQPSGEVTRR